MKLQLSEMLCENGAVVKVNAKSAISINQDLIIHVYDGNNAFLMQVRIPLNVNPMTTTVL